MPLIIANAQKDSLGLNAKHAPPLEHGISDQIHVYAQLLKHYGMEINVFVIRIYSVITVFHALLQEHGILLLTNAFARHLRLFGLEAAVNVQLDFTAIIVYLALPQDIGTLLKINVFAQIL